MIGLVWIYITTPKYVAIGSKGEFYVRSDVVTNFFELVGLSLAPYSSNILDRRNLRRHIAMDVFIIRTLMWLGIVYLCIASKKHKGSEDNNGTKELT